MVRSEQELGLGGSGGRGGAGEGIGGRRGIGEGRISRRSSEDLGTMQVKGKGSELDLRIFVGGGNAALGIGQESQRLSAAGGRFHWPQHGHGGRIPTISFSTLS